MVRLKRQDTKCKHASTKQVVALFFSYVIDDVTEQQSYDSYIDVFHSTCAVVAIIVVLC